ncbi:MAG TPA: phosphoribosyltransferase [Thermoanaerobaculia bacterium]
MMVFANRSGAGRLLADRLSAYAHRDDVIVLALPRGGVPVAYEIAEHLGVPLDVLIVRRIGTPGMENVAMGAVASGGIVVINQDVVSTARVLGTEMQYAIELERDEVERREKAYRSGRLPLDVKAKTVILVDDGAATGATMRAAVLALRRMSPARIVVALPVAAEDTTEELKRDADDFVCLSTPHDFYAVSLWYADFPQISDDEVRELLGRAAELSEVTA